MSILFVAANRNKPNEAAAARKKTMAKSRCRADARPVRGFGISNGARQKIFALLGCWLSCISRLEYDNKVVLSR